MQTTNELSSEALFKETINLINKGDLAGAAANCRRAVAADSSDVSSTALLGAILIKTKEPIEAEKYLREAIDLAPTFAKPHEDLGYLLLETDRSAEAVTCLENAARLDPKSEKAFYMLGKAYSKIGDGQKSDAAYEKSFGLNPERKKLAHAAEHHKAGRFKEAELLYRETLRDYPNNVDAMRMLAGIVASQSFVEEAESLFRRALSLAPDYGLAFLDFGMLLQDQHRYAEALHVQQLWSLKHLNPIIFWHLFLHRLAKLPVR